MFDFLDFKHPIGLAHRGYDDHGEIPENSLRAFQKAIDLGYVYLETDVHATRDGKCVIFHDDDTRRMLGTKAQIRDLLYSELQEMKLNGTDPVPTLKELLTAFSDSYFNIDIKTPQAIVPFVETVEELQCHDRICVASFSDARRKQVLSMLTKPVATSNGIGRTTLFKISSYLPGKFLSRMSLQGIDALNVPADIQGRDFTTPRFVKKAHKLGLKVLVFTVNDRDTMNKLLDMGVDGIFTDEAELLKEVLEERDFWPSKS